MAAPRTHSGVHRLAVVGVGMMGGSLALASLEHAHVDEVVGFDSDPGTLEEALSLGVITEAATSAAEAAAYADLVVVSTPVRSIPGLVEECASAEPSPRLITDMGSTKSAIMEALSPRARATFVGGHPMCGAADSGVRYARPDLFLNSTYFLCTTGAAYPRLYGMLQQFVTALGAKPTLIDATAHDRIMAVISHLPHVLANVLMEYAGSFSAGGRQALQLVGASFTDLTRVAGANPIMWRDIFLENRGALAESLQAVAGELDSFATALKEWDEPLVTRSIETAAAFREQMLEYADIAPDTLFRVTVRVPDEAGMIARVMNALAEARINVEDLTLHHMSRSAGGDLELFIAGREVAETAAELLTSLGYGSGVSLMAGGSE
jgi:prephenate dehydrogenase